MAGDPMKFRPDLEGLRGLAILLVVLFHAGVRWFAGGFVGVDVFFVLSGFFITGLLVRELDQSGRIDVPAFYARRALRLIPPLLVVLLVTLGLVMWLYAPIDRAAIAQTARSVSLYSANIHFAQAQRDYFGSAENPLLHTWSLAVEEQFYLVWPLLLIALVAWTQRRRSEASPLAEEGASPGRDRLAIGIAVCGALSLVLSVWMTRVSQQWAFYGMPTRIWEFALGAVLALKAGVVGGENAPARWPVVQVVALLAIAVPVVTYDRITAYPGTAAVWPALGAAVLIVAGGHASESMITRALSWRWLRWLGRLSYAWYLWHWPLVGLGAVIDPRIGVFGKLLWSAVALALAWLTYRFVENGARDGVLARIPAPWIMPAALGASVVAALLAHVAMGAASRATSSEPQRRFAAARSDRMDHDCWATTIDDPRGACEFGDTRSSTVIALLGDSHAEHWLAALDRVGRERGWRIVAMVKGGCPVADMPRLVNARFKRFYHECTRYREAMLRRIVAMRPNAVILSSWDHYIPVNGDGEDWQVTPSMWYSGLRRTYARLTGAGIMTVAIRGTPRAWFDVPACLSRRAAGLPFARRCDFDRDGALAPAAVRAQSAAARGFPIRFVDMNDQICAAPKCSTVRNGAIMFTDDNHLTATFSRTLAPVLGARLAAAMNQ
ncbi:MAG TPA: acyltransferase family protein [Gemmatimonadaceae bacterium]|nr:acyltransferase family protein [Gemmatimonadaceae bacterium]